MAKCKFCGEPVKAAPVFHKTCWEKETQKVAGEFCDKYCKFPDICETPDELQDRCAECALVPLLNLGEQV